MKILFIRHGEAMDDVEDRYGGWADFSLSLEGVSQAEETGRNLIAKGIVAEKILTSPLKRASQTAEIIAKVLNLSVETFVYLKERNTYGLLCGLNKGEAQEKYPELVEAYESGQPVLGYEDYDFFLSRVKSLIELLRKFDYESIICVTHGKLLKALLKDILGREVGELGDNCLVEIELEEGGIKLLSANGVELSE